MGKKITKADDLRKPKHGNDTNRPSKGEKGQRTAATVSKLGGFLRCFAWSQAIEGSIWRRCQL